MTIVSRSRLFLHHSAKTSLGLEGEDMPTDACMTFPGFRLGSIEDSVPLRACLMTAEQPVQASGLKHRAIPQRGSSILLVDDDSLIREAVGCMLTQLGFTPVLASTGEEALAELEGGLEPSLVILDMDMPGLGWSSPNLGTN